MWKYICRLFHWFLIMWTANKSNIVSTDRQTDISDSRASITTESWLTLASSGSCSCLGSTPYLGRVAPQKLFVCPSGFLTPEIRDSGAPPPPPLLPPPALPLPLLSPTLLLLAPAPNSSSNLKLLMSTSCCLSEIKIHLLFWFLFTDLFL